MYDGANARPMTPRMVEMEFSKMSVRQLKQLIEAHRGSCEGCVEKSELVALACELDRDEPAEAEDQTNHQITLMNLAHL